MAKLTKSEDKTVQTIEVSWDDFEKFILSAYPFLVIHHISYNNEHGKLIIIGEHSHLGCFNVIELPIKIIMELLTSFFPGKVISVDPNVIMGRHVEVIKEFPKEK